MDGFPRDEAGQGLLFERLRADLVAQIRHELPPPLRPRLDPEDVYQECCRRSLARLDQFTWRGEASFRGFLMTIARNYMTDVLRRKSTHQPRLQRADSSHHGQRTIEPEDRDPRATRLFRDRDAVETYLSRLSEVEARTVRLKALEGRPFAEVGEAISKTDEAARKIFNRAIEKLVRFVSGDAEPRSDAGSSD